MKYEEYINKKKVIKETIRTEKSAIKELRLEKKILKHDWKNSKNEKAIIKAEKRRIKKEKSIMINQPPHLTLLEEIGNAVTHGLGSIFAISATVLMLIYSTSVEEIIASVIYGSCMIILFTMSCLYHSFKYGSKVKRVFRRFDYSSIYLLVGGTLTPILMLLVNNTLSLVFLIIMWVLIATGITFVAIFGPGRLKGLHFPLYFSIGWIGGFICISEMLKSNLVFFFWILSGGLVYTFGMIPFCFGTKKNAHFIWHFFVVIGAILQWLGIFIYLFLR